MTGPGTVLARAFHDDPMFTFIEPDAERRAAVLPWFFGAAARPGAKYGKLERLLGVDPTEQGRGRQRTDHLRARAGGQRGVSVLPRDNQRGERALLRATRVRGGFGERAGGLPRFWTMLRPTG
ncbi:hypothetical protein OG225_28635 [Nocardia sp. NBC_01377]|uniref:hypothetical protein n=1 Tax=Nocardia sp. NBC_01377 TaxID=2903595 RepID=UPI00324419BA